MNRRDFLKSLATGAAAVAAFGAGVLTAKKAGAAIEGVAPPTPKEDAVTWGQVTGDVAGQEDFVLDLIREDMEKSMKRAITRIHNV